MKAYVFPGQGAQYPGMGKELFETNSTAKNLFEKANDILGFRITDIMFNGTDEELKQTKVTQPAIFLHSVILAKTMGTSYTPQMVAGHSLGEFSALVANNTISFEDGLKLVSARAQAMQKACEAQPSTMAAILMKLLSRFVKKLMMLLFLLIIIARDKLLFPAQLQELIKQLKNLQNAEQGVH